LHGTLDELRHADPAHHAEVTQVVSRLFLRGGTRSAVT
jgi:hypothetical protein